MSAFAFAIYDSAGNLVAQGVRDSEAAPLNLTGWDPAAPNQYTELLESDDVLIFGANGLRTLDP